MFGSYRLEDFHVQTDYFLIKIENKKYFRKCLDEVLEKYVIATGEVTVCPVEPVNKPKQITTYFQLNFRKPILVAPNESVKLYATFPVEIGVFVGDKNIDVFTASKVKYTLYGTPVKGVICRYWESEVYFDEPDLNPLLEGVLKLNITNRSDDWVEIRKIVFNVLGMRILYDDKGSYAEGVVKVTSQSMAETEFLRPKIQNMKESLKIFRQRKISGSKYFMEMGI